MISKAFYKRHTIFYNLIEQFIHLMEISFYIMYFPESSSSIPRQQKNVLSQQITLEKRSNGLYNLVHHTYFKREKKRPCKVGSVMMFRLVLLKTPLTKFVFDFRAILAPRHVINPKCLLFLTYF